MLFLVTGTPGAGKTLLTIKFVNEAQQFKGRQIFYYGIKGLDPSLGWTELTEEEVYKWHEFPSGSVFVFDEAYTHFPARHSGKQVPPHVEKLATHRHGGFDIVMICQKVSGQLDPFIRGLVGRHHHYARVMGSSVVNRFQWDVCQQNPDSAGVRRDANVSPMKHDKSYFGKYHSADEHTHTSSLPWGRFAILAIAIIACVGGFMMVKGRFGGNQGEPISASPQGVQTTHVVSSSAQARTLPYAELYKPEVDGLPWTAPVYREVQKPVTYPRPNCIQWQTETNKNCRCYSQQATLMSVPQHICQNIVRHGFFDVTRAEKGRKERGAAGEEA